MAFFRHSGTCVVFGERNWRVKVNQVFAEFKFSDSSTLILLKIEKILVLPKSAEKNHGK